MSKRNQKGTFAATISFFLSICSLFVFLPRLKARDAASQEAARQAAIIKAQRSQGLQVNKALGAKLKGIETRHFIIFSDFSSKERKKQAETAEHLYRSFNNIFRITERRDKMWNGKCVLFLFKRKKDFLKFALKFDYYDASESGGYFRIERNQIRVVLFRPPPGHSRRLEETLVHETAHAFLYFYRKVVAIPKWLDEGLAEYFRFDYNPKSLEKKEYVSLLRKKVNKGENRSARTMMTLPNPTGPDDTEGYATAWSMVEFLVKYDSRRFVHFVKLIKEGMQQEEALRQSYGGWNYERFEVAWKDYVAKEYS